MELKFKRTTVNLPNSLDEITFGKWLDYSREIAGFNQLDPASLEAQVKLVRMCEILAGMEEGELDELMIDEVALLIKFATEMVNATSDFKPDEAFQIEERWYAGRTLKTMSDLTNGEYISLKTLQTQYEADPLLFLPLAVAILIRPAMRIEDGETGETKWVLEKFSSKDIENLEWRANLFKEKALAKDIMPVISFFLNGKDELMKNTETSLAEELQLTDKETPLK